MARLPPAVNEYKGNSGEMDKAVKQDGSVYPV